MNLYPKKLFKTVGNTPIIPLSFKIMSAFVVLILISTFTTNYLNLVLNQRELIQKNNELLVKELKEDYTFASNQYDIFQYSGDRGSALDAIRTSAARDLKMDNSRAFGLLADGAILFQAANGTPPERFTDAAVLEKLNTDRLNGKVEGSVRYNGPEGEFFGVYKYLDKWDCYVVRSELYSDLLESSNRIFRGISLIILVLVAFFLVIGLLCINHILRFVGHFAQSMLKMQEDQSLGIIDLAGAPNDDVTYLGASFNTLSATINNLMTIFRKFVTQDVVQRAYLEHSIKLEGKQMELAILFSDIRGFTYMTETLGNDIIDLLNVHYDRAIKCIHEEYGIVGSIIGDAVLAVYGTLGDPREKALQSLRSAYAIQAVTAGLREEMTGSARVYREKPSADRGRGAGFPRGHDRGRRRHRRRDGLLRQHRVG